MFKLLKKLEHLLSISSNLLKAKLQKRKQIKLNNHNKHLIKAENRMQFAGGFLYLE